MKEFIDKISKQVGGTIAIDFDGVIHKNSKGFHDGTVYDKPVYGVKKALKELSEKYRIVIFTCKADPDRPLINGKMGAELIWEWLDNHDLSKYIYSVTPFKPRAKYYIDDKGITFKSWEQTIKEIK